MLGGKDLPHLILCYLGLIRAYKIMGFLKNLKKEGLILNLLLLDQKRNLIKGLRLGERVPYIKSEYRDILNRDISELLATLKHVQSKDLAGCLNYVITLLVDGLYGKGGYDQYNTAIGVLECIKQEFYSRRISPYEIEKCVENGDVYTQGEEQCTR